MRFAAKLGSIPLAVSFFERFSVASCKARNKVTMKANQAKKNIAKRRREIKVKTGKQMNKRGKFLKKLVVVHRWESKAGNLVLTTELKT